MIARGVFIAVVTCWLWVPALFLVEVRVGGERIDYIEYYDYQWDRLALVGNVYADGQPRHTIDGFSLAYQYSPEPQFRTAGELFPVMGCPAYQDALELALIANGAEIKDGMA
jgi:hypothetical protein